MNLKVSMLSKRSQFPKVTCYMIFWKRQNYRDGKQINGCQVPEVEEGFDNKGSAESPPPPHAGVMELFSILTVVVVTQIYT